jgi:hypothetical protein
MEKKRNIHWPSIFWFLVSIISIIAFAYEQKTSLLLQALGFICLGYSSIRLMPGDFFIRKLSLSKMIQAKTEYRQSEVLIQNLGFMFVLLSLVVNHVIGI